MPADKDDQRPTNALSAMINHRSLSAMPGGSNGRTQSPYFANPQSSHAPYPNLQESFDHAAPIRRHNLVLSSAGPQSQSSNVLVPNTSSPESAFRTADQNAGHSGAGGFMSPSLGTPHPTSNGAMRFANPSYTSSAPTPASRTWDMTQFPQTSQASEQPSAEAFFSASNTSRLSPNLNRQANYAPVQNQPKFVPRPDGPPPQKRLTRIEDHDSPLPSNASTPGSTSGMLNDVLDRVQIHSQTNSNGGTPPPVYSKPMNGADGDSSPPVIGPGGKKRGRPVIEDDESQTHPAQSTHRLSGGFIDLSQSSPQQPSRENSSSSNEDFIRFKKLWPVIDDALVRSAWQRSNGDVQKASKLLTSTNPLLNPSPTTSTSQSAPSSRQHQHGYEYAPSNGGMGYASPQQTPVQQPYPGQMAYSNAQRQPIQRAPAPGFYASTQNGGPRMPMIQTRTIPRPMPNGYSHQQPQQRVSPQQAQQYNNNQLAQQRRMLDASRPKMQESKLVAAHKPQPSNAPASKKRKHIDSDEEDDGRWSDNSNNDFAEDDGPDPQVLKDAVTFFNNCQPQEILDYTACRIEIAKQIVGLRPFADEKDIRNKLKGTKGISNKLFDTLVDVLQAYKEIDKVFEKCVEYGKSLSRVMQIWSGTGPVKAINPVIQNLSAPSSRAGTPDTEAGLHMTNLDEDAFEASQQVTAQDDVKDAFKDYIRTQPAIIPSTVKLKGYQMLGINWLNLLYNKRLSCILADDMGLGKTCQVISFFAHLKETGKPGPHLVVVPSSTLDNWLREFDTFAPSLKVQCYYGSQAARAELRHDLKKEKDIDVIVTTYNMASGSHDDKRFLKKMEFQTCVYDEGHQLKNSNSKKYRELMEIQVKWRLLLTGTPLQNNLVELVSLLSFILPDLFKSVQDSLQAIFKVPPDAQANMLSRRRIEAAKSVMTPFVLRRKKLQVLQELPKKTERVEYCTMTSSQRQIYRDVLRKSKKVILEKKEEEEAVPTEDQKSETKPKGKKGRKAAAPPPPKQADTSSNILMELRKAACHPMLFRRLYNDAKIGTMSRDCLKELEFSDRDPKYILEDMEIMTDFELHRFVQPYRHLVKYGLQKEEWMQGGKVNALKKMLPEMRERGDRVLLFSQFTQVLDLLESVLDSMGIRWIKLTGQTNVAERQGLVDEFDSDPEITVFLLSTRAGGLGLNLAAANVVIIHDQDFNPHNDRQAEDRAWRIGQTRDVSVIRLIVKNTIEEQMFALANTKLALDSQVSKATGDTESGAEDQLQEGSEGVVEKKVKSTLISTLRAQLENSNGDDDDLDPEPFAGESGVQDIKGSKGEEKSESSVGREDVNAMETNDVSDRDGD